MSLNCLKSLKRTNSGIEMQGDTLCPEKGNINRFLARVERNWTGNLSPRPNYGKMRTGSNLMAGKKEKEAHFRTHHSGPADLASPRLVRSSGMRRDWSFEDLRI